MHLQRCTIARKRALHHSRGILHDFHLQLLIYVYLIEFTEVWIKQRKADHKIY
jgi:hypothetical protein